MNPTEYGSSDEYIPACMENIYPTNTYMINGELVWDICKDKNSHHFTFRTYDSEGKVIKWITTSSHQARPYSEENGEALCLGYEEIKTYLR
jgi:hypothetical protein